MKITLTLNEVKKIIAETMAISENSFILQIEHIEENLPNLPNIPQKDISQVELEFKKIIFLPSGIHFEG